MSRKWKGPQRESRHAKARGSQSAFANASFSTASPPPRKGGRRGTLSDFHRVSSNGGTTAAFTAVVIDRADAVGLTVAAIQGDPTSQMALVAINNYLDQTRDLARGSGVLCLDCDVEFCGATTKPRSFLLLRRHSRQNQS